MPHKRCTVCAHPECQAADTALARGDSLREVAQRYGFSKSSIERHARHARGQKSRLDSDELNRIDGEIRGLRVSQAAARRRGEAALVLRIAREIRQWHETRAKAVAMFDANRHGEESTITPQEALQLARSVIEAHLNEFETKAWLRSLVERIDAEAQPPQQTEAVEAERVADE